MPNVTVNGHDLLKADIVEPLRGRWYAAVEADTDEPLTGAVTIDFGDGITFVGTALPNRAARESGRSIAGVVGGAGALQDKPPARAYTSVSFGRVLTDTLDAVGETLSSTAQNLDAELRPRWVRAAVNASATLDAIADELDLNWRVLRDGTVWLGQESFETIDVEHERLDQDPRSDARVIAPNLPAVRPGTTFEGVPVAHVTTTVRSGGIRQQLRFNDDRLRKFFARLYGHFSGRADIYGVPRLATVIKQNADGTLELIPDDAVVGGAGGPGISNVELWYGAPGESITVSPGARVGLLFWGGDPTKPFAALWKAGASVAARSIDADDINLGAAEGKVVREGDIITLTDGSTGTISITGTTHPSGDSDVDA